MRTTYEVAMSPKEGIRASRSSPVIVATDGHDQSNSAMLMARLLAGEKAALRVANDKFQRRFDHLEQQMKRDGYSFRDRNLEQLEEYWQKAKAEQSG